jgi:hypothetical protein
MVAQASRQFAFGWAGMVGTGYKPALTAMCHDH